VPVPVHSVITGWRGHELQKLDALSFRDFFAETRRVSIRRVSIHLSNGEQIHEHCAVPVLTC
jgi:hypothetical protein